MATVPQPSTPTKQPPASTSTPQTGTWKHPRFDEISRRQNASTFSDRNLKRVIYNGGGLLALWFIERLAKAKLPVLYYATNSLQPYSSYFHSLIQIILILNVAIALLPLARRRDNLSDIPLTPAQRRLLGLPPTETPPTPGSQYITPPRYPRSSTPQSVSPGSGYSPSPLSGKGNSTPGTSRGSPFSPNASPLLSRAVGGGLVGAKRSSFGSPSPLRPGISKGNWFDGPPTPSPSAGKGPSVTLNNKWLWDKGRRSSGDARVFY